MCVSIVRISTTAPPPKKTGIIVSAPHAPAVLRTFVWPSTVERIKLQTPKQQKSCLAKFASRSPEPTFERDRGRWVQALLPAALDFLSLNISQDSFLSSLAKATWRDLKDQNRLASKGHPASWPHNIWLNWSPCQDGRPPTKTSVCGIAKLQSRKGLCSCEP